MFPSTLMNESESNHRSQSGGEKQKWNLMTKSHIGLSIGYPVIKKGLLTHTAGLLFASAV